MDPSETAISGPPEASRLPLVAMAAIAVLAVLAGLALGLRGAASYPVGSPEAALQEHLNAIIEVDEPAILASIDPGRIKACEREFDRNRPRDYSYEVENVTVVLESVDVDGDTAIIELTQRSSEPGDPFSPGGRGWRRTVELQRIDNEWLVAKSEWPFWMQNCLGRP